MKKILRMIIMGFFVFGACRVIFSQERIVIEGTGDPQQLLRILAVAFENKHPGKQIEIPESTGSSAGIKALINGKCDLARVARPLKDSEKKLGLSYKFFVLTPVVFIANNNVKEIDNLTGEQIVSIYSGKTTSWRQLGGRNAKIYVAGREKGDACRNILEKNIPGFKEIGSLAGEIVYSTPDLVKIVAENKDTIGYAPLTMVKNTDLAIMKLNGVYPSLENTRSGIYKLTNHLGIVWKGQLSGLAKEFVDFLFSPEVRDIILQNGAIPLEP